MGDLVIPTKLLLDDGMVIKRADIGKRVVCWAYPRHAEILRFKK
jgi:hypothetical protein